MIGNITSYNWKHSLLLCVTPKHFRSECRTVGGAPNIALTVSHSSWYSHTWLLRNLVFRCCCTVYTHPSWSVYCFAVMTMPGQSVKTSVRQTRAYAGHRKPAGHIKGQAWARNKLANQLARLPLLGQSADSISAYTGHWLVNQYGQSTATPAHSAQTGLANQLRHLPTVHMPAMPISSGRRPICLRWPGPAVSLACSMNTNNLFSLFHTAGSLLNI